MISRKVWTASNRLLRRTSVSRNSTAALLLAGTLFLISCGDEPNREPSLAEAFVAPATLQIRAELVARAPLVATLKHGERVEIIGRRRRFCKLRTASGATGWADSWQLLSTEGMEHLQELARQTAEAPSQGQATVFDALNVHTAPNRQAPTLFQITPGAKVEVIAHEPVARLPYTPPSPLLPALDSGKSQARKPKREPEYPPPPRPKPPGLPKDWLELSGGMPTAPPDTPDTPAPAPPAPAPMEMWSLVRARDGRSGWVLARMLLMAIPDEVAQYAERARIAAYFHMGDTLDRDGVAHPAWLWAAASRPGADFDSLRLFTWNTRRNRYETSYIKRNLTGFLPILIERRSTGEASGFSALIVEKDGSLQTRVYSVNGFRARLVSRRPATVPRRWYSSTNKEGQTLRLPAPSTAAPTWRDRVPAWVPFLSRPSSK